MKSANERPSASFTAPAGNSTRRWLRVFIGICVAQFILFLALSQIWKVHTPLALRRLPVYSPTNRVPHFVGQPGPWGELEYVRISLEPPDEFVPLDQGEMPPTRWFFADFTPAQLTELFETSDLAPGQRTELLKPVLWHAETNGIVVTPPVNLLRELSPAARSHIYSVLARSPQNDFQCWPFTFRDGGLADWFDHSGLSATTMAALKQMTYPRGPALCFSDLGALFAQVTDPVERQRVVKTLSRHSTVVLKLRIRPDSDPRSLTAYWGRGRRAKDVGPFLESLTHVPGGITVDVAHLLPPFARKRLNSFPDPAASGDSLPDCYWTAFNFFNDPPDNRYYDETVWRQELEKEFTQVTDPKLGDLVFLVRPDGVPLHCAAYVADDVVFTKNGANPRQPWLLMKLADMLARYPEDFPLRVTYFRTNRSGRE